ncbi:hypothetical protein F4810DRAFT_213734 [Camillea tinctor]|nr:hypothetical protein F4810DRAFT_213734 [Camillea tinctor]
MSDEKPAQSTVAQPAEPTPATAAATAAGTTGEEVASSETVAPGTEAKSTDSESKSKPESESAPAADDAAKDEEDKAAEKPAETEEPESKTESAPVNEPANEKTSEADVEMKDKPAEEAAEPATDAKADNEKSADATTNAETENGAGADAADAAAVEAEEASPGNDKSKARRKSSGAPDHAKGKKLNKKASKAKIQHLDAKPGDHYFAKLKGFPPWPVIVCEEDMLPQNMLNSRPVTAARPDGTYREDFADGGKRAGDRTYPVMYLYTNEFSWTPNTDLSELDAETVTDLITPKMRKDLQSAHQLAAEQNDLNYYKNVLREFEEQRLAKLEAKNNKKKTPKKGKAPEAIDEDGDIEMADAEEGGEDETSEKKSKSKKRKAEEEKHSTPQRSDSVKKPKIKLTNSSTPKAANGVQSPSVAKDASKAKGKTKSKAKDADSKKEKEQAPKEPELTPEEKHVRKEKEILFLRHRLQKGLLLRDQEPKSEEMKSMSDFLGKLETFPDLEVSIIRATKINKVLKAILRLETIPKESEFEFKPRSQTLLDKWNKLLAVEGEAPAAANGVNGTSKAHAKSEKETNGEKAAKAETKAESDKDTSKAGSCEKDTKEGSEANAESSNEDKPTATETATARTEGGADKNGTCHIKVIDDDTWSCVGDVGGSKTGRSGHYLS